MIRRLADRLVAFDLLDQAGELLQYQIDHRLEGAARAQVAARLAMVYLMNRKPDRAIAALRTTRIADLAGELRQQRLLLEARAQSDVGRRDLALDIISNLAGREAIRLRSDIYWASRRWREASEQIELYYARALARFQTAKAEREERHHSRCDRLRAVRGRDRACALPREICAADERQADKVAFDTASKPAAGNSAEFEQIAKMAAKVDTLRLPARNENAFPGCHRPGAAVAGNREGRTGSYGSLPREIGLTRAEARRWSCAPRGPLDRSSRTGNLR